MSMHIYKLSILIIIFGLLNLTGCASQHIIYVDKDNTSGPWNGSSQYPYKKIQDGLNAAKANNKHTVEVRSGLYSENLTMKSGVTLRQVSDESVTKSVIVSGAAGKPTITAKDRSIVTGLTIEGGNTGVLVELAVTPDPDKNSHTAVAKCRLLSPVAVMIKTSKNLAFGQGVRRKPTVYLSNNWISSQGSYGILIDLVGPKTGELSFYLDAVDNVIEGKGTAIDLVATGQGVNPSGITRAQITGTIRNNLIVNNTTGIRFHSQNLGSAAPMIFNNTISNNESHAIVVNASAGSDGGASTHPDVVNNIITNNQSGYVELALKTSAQSLNHNLFHNNSDGHYRDADTNKDLFSQAALNMPIVNNKFVFISGKNNQVATPQFTQGKFFWWGTNWGNEPVGKYYLIQSGGNKSPAVDAGLGSAKQAALHLQTTSTNFSLDSGIVDLGFHYTKPW